MRTLALLASLLLTAVWPAAAQARLLGAGEPLTRAFVEALITQALGPALAGEDTALDVEEPRLPLGNQSAQATEITLENFSVEPETSRFTGELVGRVGAQIRFRLPVHGRAIALAFVPVLTRPLARGERVQADDLEWRAVRPDRLPAEAIADAEALIGAEARRPLRAGRTLRAGDIGAARLVERGRPVRIVYARPGLHLTTVGTAHDSGAEGDLVRVLNPSSQRYVQGVVTGPDEVTVDAPAAPLP